MAKLTFQDIVRLIESKFRKEIPELDPTIKASLARASTVSSAAAGVSNQDGLDDAVAQSFWQSQDDDFLEKTGEYDNVNRFGEQKSSGLGAVEGVLSTLVPQDTPITYNGNSYIVLQDSQVINYSGTIFLSYSAGIVTAITSIDHSLSTGLNVTISGATQPDYNGTFQITVLDSSTFTYELVAGALTTDNGSYSSDYALLNIESVATGEIQNAESGAIMEIDLPDINSSVYVGTGGLRGGLTEEDIDDYRVRVGEAHNLTPGIATIPSIVFSVKSISGNTRVFVIRPTETTEGIPGEAGYRPELGQTVVYFVRDNDTNILPSIAQLTEAKNKIISDGVWPESFLKTENLFVISPLLKSQDFVFTSITPNTITMQNAIRDQLKFFFEDNSGIEKTIKLSDLDIFLRSVQDPATGDILRDFTYTTPNVDLTTDSGELMILGTVTYA